MAYDDLGELVGCRVRLTYPGGYQVAGILTDWKCPGRPGVALYYIQDKRNGSTFSVNSPLTATVETMGSNGRYVCR